MKQLLPLIASIFIPFIEQAQLIMDETLTPEDLVIDVLAGSGVSISNVEFNGVASPSTAQPGTAKFTTGASPTALTMEEGIVLATCEPSDIPSAASVGAAYVIGGADYHDADLQSLSGFFMNDCASLEFDFIPVSDTVKFNYVFASEEYPTYVCSSFNDAFGFFISGPGITGPFSSPLPGGSINIALIPGTSLPVTINNVNDVGPVPGTATCTGEYSAYYVDNVGGPDVVFNGFTTVLEASAIVQCGLTHHIKFSVGNATDHAFQSAVFLEAGSFTGGEIIINPSVEFGLNDSTVFEGCGMANIEFERFNNFPNPDTVFLTPLPSSTADPSDYSTIPPYIIFNPGDSVVSFPFNAFQDFVSEGVELLDIETNVINNCGMDSTKVFSIWITDVDDITFITSTDTTPYCAGDPVEISVSISGGYGQYSILWDSGLTDTVITVNPLVTTNYHAVISDTCGLTGYDVNVPITVPIYPSLIVQVPEIEQMICDYDSTFLAPIGVSGGEGSYTWNWSTGGTLVTTNYTATVHPPATATYSFTVTDLCGTTASDDMVVLYPDNDPFEMYTTNDTIICAGESMPLFVEVTGGAGGYSYYWYDFNSPETNVVVSPPESRSYFVYATDLCGDSLSRFIRVDITPITAEYSYQFVGEYDVEFQNLSQVVGQPYLEWRFENGDREYVDEFLYTFETLGPNYVELYVESDIGCKDSITYELSSPLYYYVPNTFTPNGDKKNEGFRLSGEGIVECEWGIVDRWGKTIFIGKDKNAMWDGNFYDGKPVPSGIYYFKAIVKGVKEKREERYGIINLVR